MTLVMDPSVKRVLRSPKIQRELGIDISDSSSFLNKTFNEFMGIAPELPNKSNYYVSTQKSPNLKFYKKKSVSRTPVKKPAPSDLLGRLQLEASKAVIGKESLPLETSIFERSSFNKTAHENSSQEKNAFRSPVKTRKAN